MSAKPGLSHSAPTKSGISGSDGLQRHVDPIRVRHCEGGLLEVWQPIPPSREGEPLWLLRQDAEETVQFAIGQFILEGGNCIIPLGQPRELDDLYSSPYGHNTPADRMSIAQPMAIMIEQRHLERPFAAPQTRDLHRECMGPLGWSRWGPRSGAPPTRMARIAPNPGNHLEFLHRLFVHSTWITLLCHAPSFYSDPEFPTLVYYLKKSVLDLLIPSIVAWSVQAPMNVPLYATEQTTLHRHVEMPCIGSRISVSGTEVPSLGSTNMKFNQIIGVAFLAVGGVMLYFGYTAAHGVGEQLHETFTGRFTDSTTWYFVIGAVAATTGVGLLAFRRRA